MNLISAVFRVTEGQKNPVVVVSEQGESVYYEKVMNDEFKAQLKNLSNHPYYTKAAFIEEANYKDWKEYEKARLEKLLKPEEQKPKPGLKERSLSLSPLSLSLCGRFTDQGVSYSCGRLLGDKKPSKSEQAAKNDDRESVIDHHAVYVFLVKLCLIEVNELKEVFFEVDEDDRESFRLDTQFPKLGWLLEEYAIRYSCPPLCPPKITPQ